MLIFVAETKNKLETRQNTYSKVVPKDSEEQEGKSPYATIVLLNFLISVI